MKKLLTIGAVITAAITLTPTAASMKLDPNYCTPVATIPYVGLTNYAANMGYTIGCDPWEDPNLNQYMWGAGVWDYDTGELLTPWVSGGPDFGDHNYDLETFAMCLRPDGTGRRIQSVLVIWPPGQPGNNRVSISPGIATCKRIGGTGGR